MQRSALSRGASLAQRPYVCIDCASRLGLRHVSMQTKIRKAAEKVTWDKAAEEIRAGKQKSFLSLLEERGYVKDIAGDRNALEALFTDKRVGAYAGVDPTAPSVHLGHLLPLMVLFWMYVHGYEVTSLVGGATAKIGDPTDRLTSRETMGKKERNTNLVSMHTRMRSLWKSAERYGARHGYVRELSWRRNLVNNSLWLSKVSILDFLSDVGTVARMGTMLNRDTVKNKMSQGDGMSYAEFTYPLLQAYDWWELYQTGVQIQIGGSDQYGNIVAGIDLIKHMVPRVSTVPEVKELSGPFGITVPLLTTSAGVKFGKSAGNAIWLDKDLTSPFELYGFLLRSSDADVERYLKLFTFLPLDQISTVMTEHKAELSQRKAQHLLAREVLDLVHGPEEAKKAQEQHSFARNPSLKSLTDPEADTQAATRGLDRMYLPYSLVYGRQPPRILYHAGLASSISEGTRMVQAGGAYIGASPDADESTSDDQLKYQSLKGVNAEAIQKKLDERNILILRAGKWKVKMIEVISDVDYEEKGLSAPGWEEFKEQRDEKTPKKLNLSNKKVKNYLKVNSPDHQ